MLGSPQLLLTRPVKSTNCVCALSLSLVNIGNQEIRSGTTVDVETLAFCLL